MFVSCQNIHFCLILLKSILSLTLLRGVARIFKTVVLNPEKPTQWSVCCRLCYFLSASQKESVVLRLHLPIGYLWWFFLLDQCLVGLVAQRLDIRHVHNMWTQYQALPTFAHICDIICLIVSEYTIVVSAQINKYQYR